MGCQNAFYICILQGTQALYNMFTQDLYNLFTQKFKHSKHFVNENACGLKTTTEPKSMGSFCRGGGGDLLRYSLQGVHHGDVAQTLSNRQGSVAILRSERKERK